MNERHEIRQSEHSNLSAAALERDARWFVTVAQPLITALSLAGSLLDFYFSRQHGVAVSELMAVAVMAAVTVPLMLGVRAGVLRPRPAILLALASDFAAISTTILLVPNPDLAACSFALLVPLVGYFTTTRITLATCLSMATILSVAGPRLDGWSDDGVIPSCAFILLATCFTTTFVCSRMRAVERKLEAQAASERAARERLEQVDRSRERFITNVSHELRTPLTLTISSVDTLLRSDVELHQAQRLQLLDMARRGGLRLLSLIEDLLTLGVTRPESLELALDAEPLARLVGDAVAGINPGTGRSIVITSASNAPVAVDRLRMMQVVANLVSNGLRHGAGDVIVATGASDSHALICVRDNGPGVPPEQVDELFMPFARYSPRGDNTGVGLAISRTIVEAHGGSIHYARTDEHTQFTVQLPLEHTLAARVA